MRSTPTSSAPKCARCGIGTLRLLPCTCCKAPTYDCGGTATEKGCCPVEYRDGILTVTPLRCRDCVRSHCRVGLTTEGLVYRQRCKSVVFSPRSPQPPRRSAG